MKDGIQLFSGEAAKPVEGFPLYIVTSLGRVFSLHRSSPTERAASSDAKGYRSICLRHERQNRSTRVHRLVAEAFLPNPDSLPCVRHLDGNPQNNRADNLAWGTYAENEEDKRLHGTWDARRIGKLSHADRVTIRTLHGEGWSQKALADLFDVSRPTITRLVNGTIWGNDAAAAEAMETAA